MFSEFDFTLTYPARRISLPCAISIARFLQPDTAQSGSPDRHSRWSRSRSRSARPNTHTPLPGRPRGNPYRQQPSSSQLAYFPFASRAAYAPLFHSAHDEINEEDDEQEEHAREVADFYALQRSRRQFAGNSRMLESSESVRSGEEAPTVDGSKHADDAAEAPDPIKSNSHKPDGSSSDYASPYIEDYVSEPDHAIPEPSRPRAESSVQGDRMVDITLEDTIDPTSKRKPAADAPNPFDSKYADTRQGQLHSSLPSAVPGEISIPLDIEEANPSAEYARVTEYTGTPGQQAYDVFWGHLFLLSLGGLFASALLVYIHTSPPASPGIVGDTIYSTLHASFYLLGIYTVVSVMVSLLWLALMRAYIRFIVYGMLVAVPVVLYSFSIYSFASSFQGARHGASLQDKVMRGCSIVPALIATLWAYSVIKTRHVTGKAIDILSFACRILAANPALLPLGFVTLTATVSWTWLWVLMFARVFLGGHLSTSPTRVFIIDLGTWWLGVYFVLVHLWSLAVLSGLQRAITAATVSQWYFHRLAAPPPSSRQIVRAATAHSCGMLFGTICLSSLLSLLVRLPLMLLPKRCASLVSCAVYSCVPSPVATLTSPLAITHASVHSLPLATSARSLSQLAFIAPGSDASAPAHYRPAYAYAGGGGEGRLVPYRVAKLFLHATRLVMSLSLGFGGWVISARSLQLPAEGNTIKGSVYAYVVGLVAAVTGWGVLGAVEGILAMIVDAAVICWASEVGIEGREARYCREAGELFGSGRDEPLMGHKVDEESQGEGGGPWGNF